MLMILDTETSGLFRDELPPMADEQPHMVQLGAQLFDLAGKRRAHLSVLIRPSGWVLEAAASEINGITTEECARFGVKLSAALLVLKDMTANATRIVGHNIQFDRKIIELAIHRVGGEGAWWAKAGPMMECTMTASTELCAMPQPSGKLGYKWPSLSEAVSILVPGRVEFESRHDADADIEATMELYIELVKRGAIKPQADPYARDF